MTREMKYSGVEWIGDIPSEWKVEKNKHCFEFTKNIVGEEFENYKLLSLTKKGIVIKDENNSFGKVPDSYETYQSVKQGQLVLCLFDLDCSAVFSGLSNYDGMISPAYKIYNCKECIDKKYAEYWFDYCFDGRKYMIYSKSLRYVVNADDFGTIEIVLPPLSEQKKIADFLDGKVAEIDKIITETKLSIENYKEYKQSVITEAVTKGLDKNVPMKDSGIEWIGDIPVGWDVNMLSQIFYQHKYKNKDNEENNLLSLSYGNIKRKNINVTEGLLPESFENYNIIDVNDIVLRLTDLQNDHKSLRVGYVEERGIITSAYVTIRSKRNINTKYFYYYLHTFDVHKGFYGMGCGVRQGLNFDELRKLKILYPPIDKQQQIIKYLDNICMKIDTTINKKEQLISNLEEYKKSLIYEYVTGKRTVE